MADKKYDQDVAKTIDRLMKTRRGNSLSDVLSQLTSRLSDSHNNLSKNQSREKENYQTLNTFTGKHATSLTTE